MDVKIGSSLDSNESTKGPNPIPRVGEEDYVRPSKRIRKDKDISKNKDQCRC